MTRPIPPVPVPPDPTTPEPPGPAGQAGAAPGQADAVAGPGGAFAPGTPSGSPSGGTDIEATGTAGSPSWMPVLDTALRVAGGLIAAAGAVLSAALELIFSTARVGGQLIGVSVPLAVVANVSLAWFAHRTVGKGWAMAIPAVIWFGLMVVAAGGTAEGDILLAGNNWVGLAMIVAGSMAFAVMAFRLILNPRR